LKLSSEADSLISSDLPPRAMIFYQYRMSNLLRLKNKHAEFSVPKNLEEF